MAICEAYERGDHPCPMKSYYGFKLKVFSESISEQYKITTWKAGDGAEFELKEARNGEDIDYFITPERSGNLFLRTGHSCVDKRKFSLRGVDTETGKLWLTNQVQQDFMLQPGLLCRFGQNAGNIVFVLPCIYTLAIC